MSTKSSGAGPLTWHRECVLTRPQLVPDPTRQGMPEVQTGPPSEGEIKREIEREKGDR
jgi:hypothetical protein